MQRRLQGIVSILTDYDFLPFQADKQLVRKAQELARYRQEKDNYFSFYKWIIENINYKKARQYRNSLEVFYAREGICGEQAFLFITFARVVGLQASYVSVVNDCYGKKVSHACVSVPGFLVDTSYKKFPVRHKKYSLNSDGEVGQYYQQWRYGE